MRTLWLLVPVFLAAAGCGGPAALSKSVTVSHHTVEGADLGNLRTYAWVPLMKTVDTAAVPQVAYEDFSRRSRQLIDAGQHNNLGSGDVQRAQLVGPDNRRNGRSILCLQKGIDRPVQEQAAGFGFPGRVVRD